MPDPIRQFDHLVAQIAGASGEQQPLVDRFVAEHPWSPLIGTDEAIIWYAGSADQVILRGDMLREESQPLTRLGHTTLWFFRRQYETDARLDYHLLVDGVDLGDPRNERQVPSGYGPRAELRTPGYRDPELWRSRPGVAQGRIDQIEALHSVAYPGKRTMWIYTPPGYDLAQGYPSVYFHDGGDYLRFANARALFDNLIHDGTIQPCIAVFVDPSEHGRVADYDLNHRYVRFICDELVPLIDGRYSTRPRADQRAMVGASFGGLIALLIAHERPDVFGLVGSQSGFVGRSHSVLIGRFRDQPRLSLRIHLIIGTYETQIGPIERGHEANFLAANRELRAVLARRGYDHDYHEYHEGHSWGLWRARLAEALQFLLGHR